MGIRLGKPRLARFIGNKGDPAATELVPGCRTEASIQGRPGFKVQEAGPGLFALQLARLDEVVEPPWIKTARALFPSVAETAGLVTVQFGLRSAPLAIVRQTSK